MIGEFTEFQPNFYSNIKKGQIYFEFFSNFFFEQIFSYKFFFGENLFHKIFFFSQKYFCEDFFHNIIANFFCIWCLRNNVCCEIFYSKFCLLRIFLFCYSGVRKKKLEISFAIFFSAINMNTKFENVSFLKKKKKFLWSYFWISLLTIRKIKLLGDEQRTRKIQNNVKSTTGYLK